MANSNDWLRLILEAYATHNRLSDMCNQTERKAADDQLTRVHTQSWYRFWRRLRNAHAAQPR